MKHFILFFLGISAWLCTTAQDPLPEEQLIVNWTLALESDLICYDIVIDGDAWYVNDQHDVFKSTDGGETWDDTPWPLGIVRDNTSVMGGIEASNGKLVVGALDNGYYVSNDAGNAYSATGPTGFGCASVSILSLDDGAFLGTMGGFQRGLYRLPNGSTSGWEKTFSGRDCGSLAHSGNFIFATDYGTSNGGMLASSDNGFSWNYIYSGSGGASPNSGCIWNDKLVFVTKDKRVFHHDIGSSSAVEVGASPIELNWVTHTSDGIILGLSHNESMAFLSNDGGLSWSGFSLPEANYYSSLREHNGEILLTTQGGLYRGYFDNVYAGCIDETACNFDAAATLDDESCEYGCTYCGPGTSWNADAQICVVTTSPYLNEPGEAAVINPCYFDSDQSGIVEVTDLMNLLSVYGMSCFWECGDPLSYQGYDYETVQIGEQCWFAENARYLPAVSPPEMGSVTEPHAYVFGYSGSDVSEAELLNGAVLYNGITLTEWDICPNGWHVPTELEWQVQELQLGMSQDEIDIQDSYRGNRASALKSESEGWQINGCSLASPGTDESGFAAEPVGIRHFSGGGTFTNPCGETTFWSSTDFSRRAIAGDNEGIYRSTVTPEYGFSVRCLKDAE